MKGIVFLILTLLSGLLLTPAWAEENATAETPANAAASEEAAQGEAGNATMMGSLDPFPSERARLSYAVGMYMAYTTNQLSFPVEHDFVMRGARAMYDNETPLISSDEALTLIRTFSKENRDRIMAERNRVRPLEEIRRVILAGEDAPPKELTDSMLLPAEEFVDPMVVMNAKNYDFTVQTFFDAIEWGMQGKVANATWSDLGDNRWQLEIGSIDSGNDPHKDIMVFTYKPDANQTMFSEYTVDDEVFEGEKLEKAYQNVFGLHQKQ